MAKIYVISFSDFNDLDEVRHAPRAFADADAAIKALNEIYENADSQITTSWERKKTDTSFEIYKKGKYPYFHFSGWINEVNVK